MRSRINPSGRFAVWAVSSGIFFAALVAVHVPAQTSPYERAFPQSKATVEKALTAVQSNLAGHLPVLDGFAKPGEHPLDRYQRAYYQSTVQVSSTPSGGSLVRVSTKVTAWYADPVASHSGYQLLTSNGRLEADLLDQLAEQLTESGSPTASVSTSKPTAWKRFSKTKLIPKTWWPSRNRAPRWFPLPASMRSRSFLPACTMNSKCSTSTRTGCMCAFPACRGDGSGATVSRCPMVSAILTPIPPLR